MARQISFTKMHGIGNDFVIIDERNSVQHLSVEQIVRLSDRHKGIGCDQLILIRNAKDADLEMRIYNQDGSMSGICGNATRCVADLYINEPGHEQRQQLTIKSGTRLLRAWKDGWHIAVDMGAPKLDWQDIPLAEACDTLAVPVSYDSYRNPVAVSMGNPHLVFVVDDVAQVDLERVGPVLEHDEMLPERANISFIALDRTTTSKTPRLYQRVWERGSGETLACGSGACAALVAATLKGLVAGQAEMVLPGGSLHITWEREKEGHVIMKGPAEVSFLGVFHLREHA